MFFRKPLPLETLTAYLNGGLSSPHRLWVRARLAGDARSREALAALMQVKTAVQAQEALTPSQDLFDRISTRLPAQSPAAPRRSFRWDVWAWGLGVLALVFFAGWYFLPPGIQLRWSAHGTQPEIFQIYRTSANAGDLELVATRPAKPGIQDYTFTDIYLLPGRTYVYQVHAVQQDGTILRSPRMTGNTRAALPGQILVLLAGAALIYGLFALQNAPLRQARMRLAGAA